MNMEFKEDVLEALGASAESVLKESALSLIELRALVRPTNDELALQVLDLSQKLNQLASNVAMICKLQRPFEPLLNKLATIKENLKYVKEIVVNDFAQNSDEYHYISHTLELVDSVPEIGNIYNETRKM